MLKRRSRFVRDGRRALNLVKMIELMPHSLFPKCVNSKIMFFVEGLSFCAQRRCSNPPPASALAYFKYVPLFIALPLLLVLFLAYRVYQSTAENKPMALVKTLEDEAKSARDVMDDLLRDEEKKDRQAKEKEVKKMNRKKAKAQQQKAKQQKRAPQARTNTSSTDEADSDSDDTDFDYGSIVRTNKSNGKKER